MRIEGFALIAIGLALLAVPMVTDGNNLGDLPPAPAGPAQVRATDAPVDIALLRPVPDRSPTAGPTAGPVTAIRTATSGPTAPPPPLPPPRGSGLTDAVLDAVCAPGLPWSCDWALDTTLCESTWDPTRINPAGYWGLWQINYWFEGWDDPVINTAHALLKWEGAVGYWGDGRHPWPGCGY